MKKKWLYVLLIPIVYVNLISGDCDWFKGDDKPFREVKVYLNPRDIGWHELCGGGITGSQTVQWDITTTIYSIDPVTGAENKWGTNTQNAVHGVVGDYYVFMKVPQNEEFRMEFDLVSTRCYRDAHSASSCPSRCARFSRKQSTTFYNWSHSEIRIKNDDVMWGPCC